ncbi:MAG: hypothetical protein VB122_02830 [Erysipelotrichales bacterium]|nr:hypothetical protein [Erysipelotrichales bacterium]
MVTKMTKEDASRIQSTQAKKNGVKTKAGSFPARAQKGAAKNNSGK